MLKVKYTALALFFVLYSSVLFSQNKSLRAEKVPNGSITIDGIPDENEWAKAQKATNFTEWDPTPGKTPKNKTEISVVYDETSIYFLAVMYESDISKISRQLTERDDPGTTDNFGITFDPYGDDALSYCFGITAAGVQFDFKKQEHSDDFSWNAVWKSAVNITDTAWIAEVEIPYSALRFPIESVNERKINFIRFLGEGRRHLTWNPVDRTENNFNLSNGYLENFTIDKTPIRLSLAPYVSAYLEKRAGYDQLNYFVRGGADLKYGISEGFTLDMMLIPDFGQVRSDDQNLNLSPYEIYYSEKRSFFLEGTELFNRGDIFYSRRIGGRPQNYYQAQNDLQEHEVLRHNPSELQLLNAAKVSGKTKGGTSIGLLNALSLKSKAIIEDTLLNTEREYTTQAFTNYNVTAFEQNLRNDSYLSFINTNMSIPQSDFFANTLASDFKFAEKSKSYALFGKAAYSHNNTTADDTQTGYYYNVAFNKIRGNFKFGAASRSYSDNYNPNYMGYLQSNNRITNSLSAQYDFYNPTDYWLRVSPSLYFEHNANFLPRHLQSTFARLNVYALTKNHLSLWLRSSAEITDFYGFDETRTQDRYYRRPPSRSISPGFSTNYAKTFAFDVSGDFWYNVDLIQYGYNLQVSPRLRPTESVLLIARSSYTFGKYNAYYSTRNDEIIYGMRLRDDFQNTLDFKFIFNNKSSLSLRVSHIRSTVEYESSQTLRNDGFLDEADYELSSIDFNMFNAYLMYQLEFLPGSFLSIAWQNDVMQTRESIYPNYFRAFSENLQDNPDNSLSVRLLFYIDYFTTKNKLAGI